MVLELGSGLLHNAHRRGAAQRGARVTQAPAGRAGYWCGSVSISRGSVELQPSVEGGDSARGVAVRLQAGCALFSGSGSRARAARGNAPESSWIQPSLKIWRSLWSAILVLVVIHISPITPRSVLGHARRLYQGYRQSNDIQAIKSLKGFNGEARQLLSRSPTPAPAWAVQPPPLYLPALFPAAAIISCRLGWSNSLRLWCSQFVFHS